MLNLFAGIMMPMSNRVTLVIVRQISNISKINDMILTKIHTHIVYITYKIVYKFGADTSSRSREITI